MMLNPFQHKEIPTLEYLILLGLVVAIVLAGLNTSYVDRMRRWGEYSYNTYTNQLMGEQPDNVFGYSLNMNLPIK